MEFHSWFAAKKLPILSELLRIVLAAFLQE